MNSDSDPPSQNDSDPADGQPAGQPPVIKSDQLLQGRSEVLIDHLGQIYRLRATRNGKLLLIK